MYREIDKENDRWIHQLGNTDKKKRTEYLCAFMLIIK